MSEYPGRNELLLNEATMIRAVQIYLDGLHLPGKAPAVTGVKKEHDVFCIQLESEKKNA